MQASWWIGAGLALSGSAAAAYAWWRHRVHLAELRRRLSWSEESRFMLERHAETVDAQLQELTRTLQAQDLARQTGRDQVERRALLASLPDMSPGEPASAAWLDTEPLESPGDYYAATMPAPLAVEPAPRR